MRFSRLAWWQDNLHSRFGVLRVCCTQAYRVICLPWAAPWKIHRFLLFKKTTEYLPYNPSIRTWTCSPCIAAPSCLGARCAVLADNREKILVRSVFWQCSNGRFTQAHAQVFDTNEVHWAGKLASCNLHSNVIILSDQFLNLWRSIET